MLPVQLPGRVDLLDAAVGSVQYNCGQRRGLIFIGSFCTRDTNCSAGYTPGLVYLLGWGYKLEASTVGWQLTWVG